MSNSSYRTNRAPFTSERAAGLQPSRPGADDPAGHVPAYLATFERRSGSLLDHHYEPGAVLVQAPGDVALGDDPLDAPAVPRDDQRADPTAGEDGEGVPDALLRGDGGHLVALVAEHLADLHPEPPW